MRMWRRKPTLLQRRLAICGEIWTRCEVRREIPVRSCWRGGSPAGLPSRRVPVSFSPAEPLPAIEFDRVTFDDLEDISRAFCRGCDPPSPTSTTAAPGQSPYRASVEH